MVTTPLIESRDALARRVRAVFDEKAFGATFGDMQPPDVFDGFPVNEPPFYVAVDEMATAISTDAGATTAARGMAFSLRVWCLAKHRGLSDASDTVSAYVQQIMWMLSADHTLGMTVDAASASVDDLGTGATPDRQYIAAACVVIECKVYSMCPPKEIREAINALRDL